MIKRQLLFFTLILVHQYLFSQNNLPILHTTTDIISIKDGDIMRENYWNILPEEELDIYIADKTSKIKTVTFYSDIDSISFKLKPREKHNFIILLNNMDSCFTQIKSGITFQKSENEKIISDTIPFILTKHNNISIKATLNNNDTLDLMFHTATNSISLTKKAVERISNMKFNEPESINSWGGSGSSRTSENNILQIGNFQWDNLLIWENEHSGPKTDGKIGPHLFNDKIIEINYKDKIMVIHSSLPKLEKQYKKFNLLFNRSFMFIEGMGIIGKDDFKNLFLIHSGYAGSILFDDEFAAKNKLSEKLKIISESELTDSSGNKLKTQMAIFPSLSIGGTEFTDIPVGFFAGAIGRQKISVLGGDILKRFNIIFDLQQAHIYLKENSLMQLPYSDS